MKLRARMKRKREEKAAKAEKASPNTKPEEKVNDSSTRNFCMVEHSNGICECMKLVPPSMISNKSSGENGKINKNSGKKSAPAKASKSDKEKSESFLPESDGTQNKFANLPIIKCPYCDQPFKYKTNLNNHEEFVHGIVRKEPKRKQAHNLSSYKCKICSATYKTVVNLSKHLRKHGDRDHEFRCKTCGVSLKGKDLIKFHVSSSRRKVLNRCSLCRAESKKNPKVKVGTESDDGEKDPQFILGKKIPEEQIQALEEDDHMESVLTNLKRDPTDADVLTIKHEPVDSGIKEEMDHIW
ncbi:uncharacterized protein LOC143027087 isoform X2 [Oratosquilla oratoria]|uniref:uncharacterized protein LOC143027087 isoform X2 n=1 Tax=Oratosquilla oratoria TaxID=337810 RepID=UPI003F7610D8